MEKKANRFATVTVGGKSWIVENAIRVPSIPHGSLAAGCVLACSWLVASATAVVCRCRWICGEAGAGMGV